MISEKLLQDLKVSGLADDSRRVQQGDLFFCFPVKESDSFAKMALEHGACAIIAETEPPLEMKSKWIQVSNVKEARLQAAIIYYDNPFEQLNVHAITGTNGKTTSTFLMEAMLNAAGKKTALIGTICNKIGDEIVPSSLTTPGLLDLFAFARRALNAGCTDLVMEASSHALDQGRVAGISFKTALFSNLTQDHLDYHQTMDLYFEAKKTLFTKYLSKDGHAVINVDDAYGKKLFDSLKGNKMAVSRLMSEGTMICPEGKVTQSEMGMTLLVPAISKQPFETHLCGDFNVDNVLLVLGFAKVLQIPEMAIRKALENVRVHGRFELVYNKNKKHVVVDYAHTPDALERVLQTARRLCQGKLAVVFGCGGDRDKTKRPLMGSIASTNADVVWVTSDNPRTENPEDIIQDILKGISRKDDLYVIENRAETIQKACLSMNENDWLVIAGKGHENYQIIGKTKHHFDDSEEVQKAML